MTDMNRLCLQLESRIFSKISADKKYLLVWDFDGTLIEDDSIRGSTKYEGLYPYLVRMGCSKYYSKDESKKALDDYINLHNTNRIKSLKKVLTDFEGSSNKKIFDYCVTKFESQLKNNLHKYPLQLIKNFSTYPSISQIVVTASPQIMIEASSSYIGIPRNNIFGIVSDSDDIITSQVKDNITYREGKITAIKNYVNNNKIDNILAVFGDSDGDIPMMDYCVHQGGISVLMNSGYPIKILP